MSEIKSNKASADQHKGRISGWLTVVKNVWIELNSQKSSKSLEFYASRTFWKIVYKNISYTSNNYYIQDRK